MQHQRMPRPWLGLESYLLDGTRTKFRLSVCILARPTSLPEVYRKVAFVVRSSHPNIQKKSLEEKGVNIKIGLFSSQDENVVYNSISKKHTNRYLTATNQVELRMRCELLSDGVRWVFHGADRYVNSWWRACGRLACAHELAGLQAWRSTYSDWFSPMSMKRKSTRSRQLVELGIEFVYSTR